MEKIKNNLLKYIFLGIIIILFLWQLYNVFVDIYNFQQFKKVNNVLNNTNNYSFRGISEFNMQYNQEISPIKNCYLLSARNNFFTQEDDKTGGYYFGFKLESIPYRLWYRDNFFLYPRYDLPFQNMCINIGGCYDANREFFENKVSNPCSKSEYNTL